MLYREFVWLELEPGILLGFDFEVELCSSRSRPDGLPNSMIDRCCSQQVLRVLDPNQGQCLAILTIQKIGKMLSCL
jgi:hypothetical protein